MNFKSVLLASAGLLIATSLLADRKLGVINDFNKVEEYRSNSIASRQYREMTLEKNVLSAINSSFTKKYVAKEREALLKGLGMKDITFEQEKGTYNYYLSFSIKGDGAQTYLIFYNFATNPELFLQDPVDERVYLKPSDKEMERQAQVDKQEQEQTFSSGDQGSGSSDSAPGNSGNTPASDKSKKPDGTD